jgi:histidine triad (HIT) family protein
MEECIFCKIVRGEIGANKIYEDDKFLVFLDAFPSVRGQTLVIPKKHVGYFIKMDEVGFCDLMSISKKISVALQKAFNPIKVGVVIEGLEVKHVHIKLYPLDEGGFSKILGERAGFSKEETEQIQKQIKKHLNNE